MVSRRTMMIAAMQDAEGGDGTFALTTIEMVDSMTVVVWWYDMDVADGHQAWKLSQQADSACKCH